MTEFSFDKELMLTVTEGALTKLADVVRAAVDERSEKNALEQRGEDE